MAKRFTQRASGGIRSTSLQNGAKCVMTYSSTARDSVGFQRGSLGRRTSRAWTSRPSTASWAMCSMSRPAKSAAKARTKCSSTSSARHTTAPTTSAALAKIALLEKSPVRNGVSHTATCSTWCLRCIRTSRTRPAPRTWYGLATPSSRLNDASQSSPDAHLERPRHPDAPGHPLEMRLLTRRELTPPLACGLADAGGEECRLDDLAGGEDRERQPRLLVFVEAQPPVDAGALDERREDGLHDEWSPARCFTDLTASPARAGLDGSARVRPRQNHAANPSLVGQPSAGSLVTFASRRQGR